MIACTRTTSSIGRWSLSLIICVALFQTSPVQSQILTKITAEDAQADDHFGNAVSVDGQRALVGAPDDDDVATDAGAAYVFERQLDGSWLQVAKLTASDGMASDDFGSAVSLSGDRALIGAWRSSFDGSSAVGSAYLFERQEDGSWVEVAKLVASDPGFNEHFGYSVSLSGNTAMLGARQDSDLASNNGAVYVFEREADGTWQEVSQFYASDAEAIYFFGYSLHLTGDRAIVGAFQSKVDDVRSGAAYVYERQSDQSWAEVAKLSASDGAEVDWFGRSVTLLGDRALVGATQDDDLATNSGSAYLFERQMDGTWAEVAKLIPSEGGAFEEFGTSVALLEDHAFVGTPHALNSSLVETGAVYVFERQESGNWVESSKLVPEDVGGGDRFGNAASATDGRVLFGAPWADLNGSGSGAAYFYEGCQCLTLDELLDEVKAIKKEVKEDVQSGALGRTDGRNLLSRLDKVMEELRADNPAKAIEFTYLFISDVAALIEAGGLDPENGALLVDEAEQVICSLGKVDTLEVAGSADFEQPAFVIDEVPQAIQLHQNHPNPFNPSTMIQFTVPEQAQVRLTVYDMLGRQVERLIEGSVSAGTHQVSFDAANLPTGTYLYRLDTPEGSFTKTMLFMK